MSKKEISTKLTSRNKKLSGDKVQTGPCQFPFLYKGELYNECYKGKYGDWCATKIDPTTKKMLKYAFCDYGLEHKKAAKKSPKLKSKKLAVVPKPKNAQPKKLSVKKTPPKPIQAKKKVSAKRQFKVRDPLQDIPQKYLIKGDDKISPRLWELPNRKTFPNWMFTTYKPYLAVKNSMKTPDKTGKFALFKHQQLVRDYLQRASPFRGLLLYHGLGVGKTCASIAIAEGFRTDRKIVILLNKSLAKNFRVNLLQCGFEYYRTNQHWVFTSLTTNDNMYYYVRFLGLTKQFIEKNGGCMVIDYSKKANYDSLSDKHKELLTKQTNLMIDQKYEFIHLDGLNRKKLEAMTARRILDNKLIIIDEVHNLTNAMAKPTPGFRAKYLKQLIMDADNLKCVFLSGTPMINKLIEAGQLFNLLRGYMTEYVFKVTPRGSDARRIASLDVVITKLLETGLVDQHFLTKKEKTISVTRVPNNFASLEGDGLIIDPNNTLTEAEFVAEMTQIISGLGYTSSLVVEKHTAFPDDETKFLSLFFDSARNKIKNPELFKSRILGLTSYFKTNDRSLLPEVTVNELVKIPMSEYQFINYSKIRKDEIEMDQNRRKKKGVAKAKKANDEEQIEKSSYRAYSRMHCSFVFPENIPRPFPNDKLTEEEIELFEDVQVGDSLDDIENPVDELVAEKKAMLKKYEKAKESSLKKLDKFGESLLQVNNVDGLLKYSPKYNDIINRILKSVGNVFVYTEYRSLEGIAVFQIVLRANGFAPFLIRQLENGDYEQYYENDEDITKPKYAFWGGDPEKSDVIRKVYNNEFSQLPPKLRGQIVQQTKTNLRGETVKVLLTTKTGAEGIDLKNVRQVHIVEPFWNPVRVKQVKGRAVRVASHIELPERERTVEIFTYLSYITKEHLKSDRIINDDSDGLTSDQVLYNISARKLELMEDLLRIISESSIDCVLNSAETNDGSKKINCVNYGATTMRNYASVPNIDKEVVDSEKTRIVKKYAWKPVFIKIPVKGKVKEFAMRKPDSKGAPALLYNAEDMRLGIVGIPLGEILEMPDGKKKLNFFKH